MRVLKKQKDHNKNENYDDNQHNSNNNSTAWMTFLPLVYSWSDVPGGGSPVTPPDRTVLATVAKDWVLVASGSAPDAHKWGVGEIAGMTGVYCGVAWPEGVLNAAGVPDHADVDCCPPLVHGGTYCAAGKPCCSNEWSGLGGSCAGIIWLGIVRRGKAPLGGATPLCGDVWLLGADWW